MRFFFVTHFSLGLISLCFAANNALTSISFDNDYAVFRPSETLKFDLDKEMDILFLEKLEKPTLETSVYGIVARHNRTKHSYTDKVQLILYERGREKTEKTFDIDDVDMLKNMELTVDPAGLIIVSVKKFGIRSIKVFSWPENAENVNSLPNISYMAVKLTNSSTFRNDDTFLWMADLHQACPHKNAYFSCDLKITKPEAIASEDRNISAKSLHKIVYMKLQSDSANSQEHYEILIAAVADKSDPRLHLMKSNNTKVKVDTIFGDINVTVNISANSFAIRKKNDSLPIFLWRDIDERVNFFHDLKYAAVQIAESASSTGRQYGSDKTLGNVCRIFCNPIKELPWYTRWKNKLKETFTKDD